MIDTLNEIEIPQDANKEKKIKEKKEKKLKNKPRTTPIK